MRSLTAVALVGAMLTATACTDDALAGGEGETVVVTAADYEFRDLPSELAVGTEISIDNVSETELHEVVVIRLPDDEDRSIEALLELPPAEQAFLEAGLKTVVLQAPGSDMVIPAVPGTLDEAGRYAFLCFIPQGADPAEYMAAAQEATDGPPQVDGGPPHFTLGMWAEVTVR